MGTRVADLELLIGFGGELARGGVHAVDLAQQLALQPAAGLVLRGGAAAHHEGVDLVEEDGGRGVLSCRLWRNESNGLPKQLMLGTIKYRQSTLGLRFLFL